MKTPVPWLQELVEGLATRLLFVFARYSSVERTVERQDVHGIITPTYDPIWLNYARELVDEQLESIECVCYIGQTQFKVNRVLVVTHVDHPSHVDPRLRIGEMWVRRQGIKIEPFWRSRAEIRLHDDDTRGYYALDGLIRGIARTSNTLYGDSDTVTEDTPPALFDAVANARADDAAHIARGES